MIDNFNDEKGVNLHIPQTCSLDLTLQREFCMGFASQLTRTLPEKVIIFSQFLEHIHVIEQQVVLDLLQA